MKKKICILTATRAEYGLLRPLIQALKEISELDVKVAVTGAHLLKEAGETCREIEQDGIGIDKKIDILPCSDHASGISKSMGLAMIGFADYFDESKPDMLVVLGDRYETFAVCAAATNAGIPIAQIHGGETTEGALDEAFRHAITKMSYLHFTSTQEYRRRVIQLGEHPERVFCYGAIGVENALKEQTLTRAELAKELDFNILDDYAVVTYHPVTLGKTSPRQDIVELLAALDQNRQLQYILTKANTDAGGHEINRYLDQYASEHDNVKVVASLGSRKYYSALKYARMVIGNSSSGIIEAPSFQIPTVNIGDRQKGRIQAESVVNCNTNRESIIAAINQAGKMDCSTVTNPYGSGNTIAPMVQKIKEVALSSDIDLQKSFYDI